VRGGGKIMEFLKVIVPGKEGQDIDVLINKEKNGKVNEVLMLSRGNALVSVDLAGAEEKVVDLRNTTATNPRVEEIKA
jgi:hypothetical protein